jgi:hypothetical protein
MTFVRLPASRVECLEQRICFSTLPPIAVPDDLHATALSDTSVLLEWTDVATNELQYVLSRSSDGGVTYRDIVRTNPGSQNWVDQTTLPNHEYFYKIRTVTLIGSRQEPNPTRVTTLTPEEDPFALFNEDTGVLEVRGTTDDDLVSLSVAGGVLTADLNGEALTFAAIDVYRISVLTHNGADRISVAAGVGPVNVSAGRGNDSVFANTGDDRLDGGPGDDLIKGNGGDDTITGGDGNDTLYGQAGLDVIRGGKGADKLVGGDDNDSLFGDGGNDRLYGQLGIDSIEGNGGNNFIQQD